MTAPRCTCGDGGAAVADGARTGGWLPTAGDPPAQVALIDRGRIRPADREWAVLACSILCHRTTRGPILRVALDVLGRGWPRPDWLAATPANPRWLASLEARLRPLGLHRRRARLLAAQAAAWIDAGGPGPFLAGARDVRELPGVGGYGRQAWELLVLGRLDLDYRDRVLAAWARHLSAEAEAAPAGGLPPRDRTYSIPTPSPSREDPAMPAAQTEQDKKADKAAKERDRRAAIKLAERIAAGETPDVPDALRGAVEKRLGRPLDADAPASNGGPATQAEREATADFDAVDVTAGKIDAEKRRELDEQTGSGVTPWSEAASAEAKARELDELMRRGGERGFSASESKRVESLRKDLGMTADQQTSKAPRTRSDGTPRSAPGKYTPEMKADVKRAKEIGGNKMAPGPKQHVAVRAAIKKVLGRDPKTGADAVSATGFASAKALAKFARGDAGKLTEQPDETRKAMGALYEAAGSDPFARGKALAAIVAAYAERLDK